MNAMPHALWGAAFLDKIRIHSIMEKTKGCVTGWLYG